jgi:hypothetical protein
MKINSIDHQKLILITIFQNLAKMPSEEKIAPNSNLEPLYEALKS